jgi:hypothetical protein
MKLKAIVISLLAALIPNTVLAQTTGYLGNDGYLYIRGLKPFTKYGVGLGGMPVIKAGYANTCGVLRIRSSQLFKDSDRFEIKDEGNSKSYTFQYSALQPEANPPRCNGNVINSQKAWISADKKTIFVSGLTPNRGQTIKLLSQNPQRKISTNLCGYLKIRLGDNPPAALLVDGTAYPTTGGKSGPGLSCRYGELYIVHPYEKMAQISKEPEEQFKQNNPVEPSNGSTILTSSGASGITNNPSDNNDSGSGETFVLPQPEPDFYLVNGALVIANRPNNGEILGTLHIKPEDYSTLSIYGSAGAAACGRQQLSNSNSFTEPYTLKKPIRIDFWADAYMNLGNYGWKYITITAGTKLQNFPYGYSCEN